VDAPVRGPSGVGFATAAGCEARLVRVLLVSSMAALLVPGGGRGVLVIALHCFERIVVVPFKRTWYQ